MSIPSLTACTILVLLTGVSGFALAAKPQPQSQPLDNTIVLDFQLADTIQGCAGASAGTADALASVGSAAAGSSAQSQATADVVLAVYAAIGLDVQRHGNGGSVHEVGLTGKIEDALVTLSDARGEVVTLAVAPSAGAVSGVDASANAAIAAGRGTTVGLYTKGANIAEVTGRIATASLTLVQSAAQASGGAQDTAGPGAIGMASGSVHSIASALAAIQIQADIAFQRGNGTNSDVIVLDNVTAIINCDTGTSISAVAQSSVLARLP